MKDGTVSGDRGGSFGSLRGCGFGRSGGGSVLYTRVPSCRTRHECGSAHHLHCILISIPLFAHHVPVLPFVQAVIEKDTSNPDTNLSSSQAKRKNRKKFTVVLTVKIDYVFFVPKQSVLVVD